MLEPTADELAVLFWITLLAVIVSSASAVLKAGFKQFDLFGVIIIAVATGLGGGSLRDMLLDREVFWIRDELFFIASLGSALMAGSAWLTASFMGVMTGTMGGIFRDLLCNEPPVVFHSPLYATVCWGGSIFFIILLESGISLGYASMIAGVSIFAGRLLALHYNISLPRFRFKDSG